MIGDGWDGEPAMRPHETEDEPRRKRIMVVTGSRAEFGLLKPVMQAIEAHEALELLVVAAGSHLIPPATTFREVRKSFAVADSIPMQTAGRNRRLDDAEAVGRGIARFARSYDLLHPDWVVVLGDRIEAFAAASAASIGGIPVAHIHGGDRAEGVADEAMRHAISKLAHLHLPATASSAQRLERMGEQEIHVVGSPAMDELEMLGPLSDEAFESFGAPEFIVLLHPVGRHPEEEEHQASIVLDAVDGSILALEPNADPGRQGILRAYEHRGVRLEPHLQRATFVGLLRRLASSGGVLVGNSSAALIEAAAIRLPAVDVGVRQAGRSRCNNVVHASGLTSDEVRHAIQGARAIDRSSISHDYGNGTAGVRVAALLATTTPRLRKQNSY